MNDVHFSVLSGPRSPIPTAAESSEPRAVWEDGGGGFVGFALWPWGFGGDGGGLRLRLPECYPRCAGAAQRVARSFYTSLLEGEHFRIQRIFARLRCPHSHDPTASTERHFEN